jgi:hypothetical protein
MCQEKNKILPVKEQEWIFKVIFKGIITPGAQLRATSDSSLLSE